jgi:hypothetical protein
MPCLSGALSPAANAVTYRTPSHMVQGSKRRQYNHERTIQVQMYNRMRCGKNQKSSCGRPFQSTLLRIDTYIPTTHPPTRHHRRHFRSRHMGGVGLVCWAGWLTSGLDLPQPCDTHLAIITIGWHCQSRSSSPGTAPPPPQHTRSQQPKGFGRRIQR